MNPLKIILIFSIFSLGSLVYGQTPVPSNLYAQGKQLVDTLCSPYFFGRGYLKDGMGKAADFIAKKFEAYGLQAFTLFDTYFQNIQFPINRILEMEVYATGKKGNRIKLKKGIDFIPSAGIMDVSGTFNLLFVDSNTLENEKAFKKIKRKHLGKTIVVLDKRGVKSENGKKRIEKITNNKIGAKGIISIQEKLTWTANTQQDKVIRFYFLPNILKRNYKSITIQCNSELVENFKAKNVIGMIKGSTKPDSFIVFTAHYDHLGGIGDSLYFPGANDNASGTAMLLSLAKYYSRPKNQPKYTMLFVAFAAEEAGLIGSYFFTYTYSNLLDKIRFLVNMDIFGTGTEGVTVVNATEHPNAFKQLQTINKKYNLLGEINKRGPAANSDHYFFYKAGVPCFFIYTVGGIQAYHDVYDKSETLPLIEFVDLFRLMTYFVDYLEK